MDDSRQAGDCDSGYSCAYTNNLSWRSETQPLPPVLDPRVLFERLFGTGQILSAEDMDRRARYRRSILDFVTTDTKKLQTSLGPTDKRKLDEYLSSIREVERQLEKAEKDSIAVNPGMDKPYGVPPDFSEHFTLMTDMITIAFQADMTRVLTFLMTREGTSRSYREIGIADGHHPCTHHQGKTDLIEKVIQINEYHTKQLAGWLGQAEVDQGRRRQSPRQLDDRVRRRPVRRQPPSPRRSADAAHRPRRQPLQAGPPRRVPQGNADVEFPSDADGSHGRADGELRGRVRSPRSGEPDVARSPAMQQPTGRGAARPPIGIAFDGDAGNRIDAVLAIAMLNGMTAKTQARRISLSVSRPSLVSAQVADVVAAFYRGRPVAGPGGGIGQASEGMIGLPEGKTVSADAPPFAAILASKAADGTPNYTSSITGLVNTAESSVLIRNLLLAQHDGNAAIVLAGPATGLVRILDLYRSGPQIAAKCRQLVVAAGALPAGAAESSIKSDVAAARRLFAEWPTPIVMVGTEVGDALAYPAASIEKDFAWSPAHPVVEAYRAFKPMPYDAPAPALAAVLYAVQPDEGYFTLSEPGTISVLDDGRTRFAPQAEGKHRYLIVDPAQKARVLTQYTSLVSAPPAPRPGRRGGAV